MLKRIGSLLLLTAVCACVASASAEVVVETVTVGNPGNPGEMSGFSTPSGYGFGTDRICGGVDYEYEIGMYEITAGQYTEFLNAVAADDTYGLYHNSMGYGDIPCGIYQVGEAGSYTYTVLANCADLPVHYLWADDMFRFANWMHNGQPTGAQDLTTTEDGSYYLNGATTDEEIQAVVRESDATWVLPSEDEWYKAAHHKNDGVTGNYWVWPGVQLDLAGVPTNDPNDEHSANISEDVAGGPVVGDPFWSTPVGYYTLSPGPYGTFDQGGNVLELTHVIPHVEGDYYFCQRGYSWFRDGNFGLYCMLAGFRLGDGCILGAPDGFRLGRVTPELIGDLDGDGDVDLADLAQLLACYGAELGDPNYLEEADLDGNGVINLSDLSELLAHYGETA